MKNSLLVILLLIFSKNVLAENLFITAKNISLDKDSFTSIFKNEVTVKTNNAVIKSDYVKYNKKTGLLVIKNNINFIDNKKNELRTEFAEYYEKDQIFITKGITDITTEEKYILNGENFYIDNKKKIIKSNSNSTLRDSDGNKIILENFEYSVENSLFRSSGSIEIQDVNNNKYLFSQIFIDTKKKEILGSDSKAYLNQESFKINPKNDPRIFSNSVNIKKDISEFNKSIFTFCKFRKNDKCPPWSIQSSKLTHDNIKKTIYYKNAVIKVYNVPVFYFPRLSHPDPSVDRRSGFLVPSLYDTKNLGTGVSIPYFFNLGADKNLTFTSRFYGSENPLFLGEYNQAFKSSNFLADFGYTDGYKKTTSKKKAGNKSHLFAKFVNNFDDNDNFKNSFEINIQDVSNDKYLKLYKIDSNLVDYNVETLENSINFTHERDDLFFGFNTSIYESLKDDYNDKYEYILPEFTLDKNLFNNDKVGNLDLQTNYKVHVYDTNKLTNFLVNDFNFTSNEKIFGKFFNTKFLANLKNINYESKNVDIYKDDPTSEYFGSIGLFSEINLEKFTDNFKHTLKPKLLLKFASGSMRQETSGQRLLPSNVFSMNRVSNLNNYETGSNIGVGFDYKIKQKDFTKFDFSMAQVINEKENKKMSDKSSLNEKLSDLVGESKFNLSKNFSINYNFSIDQNYNDINYNEIGTNYNYGPLNIDFDYLKESKHIGDQDYFKTELTVLNKDKGVLTFNTKRNLVTDSSDFYNLSYEYMNDCLKAGLVYRREFYNDSELEPEDSLMFKITLSPFGSIDSPKFNQ